MTAELMDVETLFELEPYNGTKLEALERATTPAHCAKRIAEHEPAKLAKIIRRLQDGVAFQRVAEDFGISRNTIHAIIREHMGGWERFRANLASECFKASYQGVQKVQELMDDCEDVTKAAIATGIMVQRGLELSGIGHETPDETPLDPKIHDEWNQRLREQRERRVKGLVVEETAPRLSDGKEAA